MMMGRSSESSDSSVRCPTPPETLQSSGPRSAVLSGATRSDVPIRSGRDDQEAVEILSSSRSQLRPPPTVDGEGSAPGLVEVHTTGAHQNTSQNLGRPFCPLSTGSNCAATSPAAAHTDAMSATSDRSAPISAGCWNPVNHVQNMWPRPALSRFVQDSVRP